MSALSPEEPPEHLPARVHYTDVEAVTKQARHLPRHTLLLQLEPPELGHVRVQVRLLDERLAAAFWSDSSEVRALLHTHLPMLHQALNQQGFQTHQLSITPIIDGSVDNTAQFAQQHSAFQQFAQEGERRTPDSRRVPLASQEMLTYKNAHDGLVNVVI
jgi:flagellar hook-length control protein FliK